VKTNTREQEQIKVIHIKVKTDNIHMCIDTRARLTWRRIETQFNNKVKQMLHDER